MMSPIKFICSNGIVNMREKFTRKSLVTAQCSLSHTHKHTRVRSLTHLFHIYLSLDFSVCFDISYFLFTSCIFSNVAREREKVQKKTSKKWNIPWVSLYPCPILNRWLLSITQHFHDVIVADDDFHLSTLWCSLFRSGV